MKLLIDAGNTRIKWALVKGSVWLCDGALAVEQVPELASHLAEHFRRLGTNLHDIRQAWVSNVAGGEVARHIRDLGIEHTYFVTAQESQCGVCNGYSNAAQLGSDRWAALIAAWHQVRGKCMVVNCGTATTIDVLSGQGMFLGGLILPGVELMQHSLAGISSRLNPNGGNYALFPLSTADALFSGAIQASCGAIERQKALLDDDSPVVLSGGAAVLLQPYLGMPTCNVDDLVLRGLLLIAEEASAK